MGCWKKLLSFQFFVMLRLHWLSFLPEASSMNFPVQGKIYVFSVIEFTYIFIKKMLFFMLLGLMIQIFCGFYEMTKLVLIWIRSYSFYHLKMPRRASVWSWWNFLCCSLLGLRPNGKISHGTKIFRNEPAFSLFVKIINSSPYATYEQFCCWLKNPIKILQFWLRFH